jgi:hypothetical protein
MKPQRSNKNEGPGRPAITDQRVLSWSLPSGLLMADSGLLTIAFAGWEALGASPQTLLYSCGATLCFAGLLLIWIGTPNPWSSSPPPPGRPRAGNTQIIGIGESLPGRWRAGDRLSPFAVTRPVMRFYGRSDTKW